LERLVGELATGFVEGLPVLSLAEGQLPPDAHQKAAHLLRNQPLYFWAVSPNRRLAFRVFYQGEGFRLMPVKDIPFHQDMDLFFKPETQEPLLTGVA
jgi:hypothetical protein